jgi:hypothetical protein
METKEPTILASIINESSIDSSGWITMAHGGRERLWK